MNHKESENILKLDNAKNFPEIAKAILLGDVKKVESLLEEGSIFETDKSGRKRLKKEIPEVYESDGEKLTFYVDAFSFALSNQQKEIAKLLIDYGVVDLRPGADAPFMAIGRKNIELFSYMIEKGYKIGKNEGDISRLFINLSDAWDDAYFSIIEKMNLPIKDCGGEALFYTVLNNHLTLVKYLVLSGASVNYREPNSQSTPVLRAARENNLEIVKFLVEHGADLALKDDEGVRPYLVAKKNNNIEMMEYIKAHEPAKLQREDLQENLFQD